MSRLLDPGVLAIAAIVTAILLRDTGYGWLPIVAWVGYVGAIFLYAKGRDDERFEREHGSTKANGRKKTTGSPPDG